MPFAYSSFLFFGRSRQTSTKSPSMIPFNMLLPCQSSILVAGVYLTLLYSLRFCDTKSVLTCESISCWSNCRRRQTLGGIWNRQPRLPSVVPQTIEHFQYCKFCISSRVLCANLLANSKSFSTLPKWAGSTSSYPRFCFCYFCSCLATLPRVTIITYSSFRSSFSSSSSAIFSSASAVTAAAAASIYATLALLTYYFFF